ncbi:MAG: EpsI family protein [Desulfobacterales bacterium]|nr:MAG: EpsI family protein [Desulfobacterales bacterium]
MARNQKTKAYIILTSLLLLAAVAIHFSAESHVTPKQLHLVETFSHLDGYKTLQIETLTPEIHDFLALDDYVSITYQGKEGPITLYIGYYFSSDKISAAHSPLVCFPGQGWKIDFPEKKILHSGKHIITYEEFIAGLLERKELVMYWYQAYDTTTPVVYKNKIKVLLNKLTNGKQEHAFVRVTIPLNNITREEARRQGHLFIKAFYPRLLEYVKAD